ncbi:hypothetical protein ACWC5I_33170 [Kitasatospora sp. NPDC001574]
MTSVVTVNIRYTPPGMTEADSLHLEFQAPPGAHVELHLGPAKPAAPPEPQASPGGGWKQAAHKIVTEAGPGVWLSTAAIRDRLSADGVKIGRIALSTELREMASRGDIVRREFGGRGEYGAVLADSHAAYPVAVVQGKPAPADAASARGPIGEGTTR